MSLRQPPPSVGAPESDTVLRADSPQSEKTRVSPEGMRSRSEAVGATFTGTERFLVLSRIGEGGMGVVWRAFDRDLEREVAIKVLSPNSALGGVELQRFNEEARITGQLDHPFIVPVYEFGTDRHGARFLCMKLVQGQTLEETILEAGESRLEPSRLADLLQVFVKVCDAVSFAHSRGVIHRDLKPSNVMVGRFGEVYVMDWGLARAGGPSVAPTSGTGKGPSETPGALLGTPSYMAPEQLLGLQDRIDTRTDVFMLGAVLYHILAGHPPRGVAEVRSILAGNTEEDISPPGLGAAVPVPAELSRIAMKAMAQLSALRYPSVDALKSEVERFQRGAWHLPREQFDAGELIVAHQDLGETAYIILEGRCCAFRDTPDGEVMLREMGPGDVFGETAVFSSKPRTASVRAITDVVALSVTREVLANALGLNSWMGSFVKALADRFREVDEALRQHEQEQRARNTPNSP